MSLKIVQTKEQQAHATSITLSYGNTPTNGDLLVVWIGTTATGTTPPAGWTLLTSKVDGSITLLCYWKVASSETNSYAFTNGSTTAFFGVTAVELSGQSATPFNQTTTNSGTAAALTTTSAIPSVLNCTPFAVGINGTTASQSGLTSGYTLVTNTGTTDIANLLFSGPVTTDIVTGIAPGWTWSSSVTWCSMLVLIAPGTTNYTSAPTANLQYAGSIARATLHHLVGAIKYVGAVSKMPGIKLAGSLKYVFKSMRRAIVKTPVGGLNWLAALAHSNGLHNFVNLSATIKYTATVKKSTALGFKAAVKWLFGSLTHPGGRWFSVTPTTLTFYRGDLPEEVAVIGTAPFSILTPPDARVATAYLVPHGATLVVTPVIPEPAIAQLVNQGFSPGVTNGLDPGSTAVTVQDASGAVATVAITVNPRQRPGFLLGPWW